MTGAPFVDLDRRIEQSADLSIPEIFRTHGETWFRDRESEVLRAAAAEETASVIATGGGAVLRASNVELMQNAGAVVYLEASPEVLWQRVKANKNRPLLASENPREVLERLCAERQALYEKAGSLRVQTDGRTADDVAREIKEKLRV